MKNPQRWRDVWQRWWAARHPPSDALQLTQRNVYIVPSGAGWLFGALLAVLLVASINYQLNLGYLLTFLLAGIGLSSIHSTHATLRGLQARLSAVEPVFQGELAVLPVQFLNPGRRARHGIGLRWRDGGEPLWLDVPAGGSCSAQLAVPASLRGRHALPSLTLETRYPYGLFRAWSYWRPASTLLVWPRPETPAPPLPWGSSTHGQPQPSSARQGPSEPDGVRTYRRGDPLQQVLWKKSAQALAGGGELVSRDRVALARAELPLTWADAMAPDLEQRLARLAAWVLAAEQAGLRYSLQLPGQALALHSGARHQRECLDLLARWGEAP